MYVMEFEEIVLEELIKLCGNETARKVIDTYGSVIRFLQDNHDSAKVQAERYYREYNAGTSAEDWLQHIRKTREKYGRLETSAIERKPTLRNTPAPIRRPKAGNILSSYYRVASKGMIVDSKPNANQGSKPRRVGTGREIAASMIVGQTLVNKVSSLPIGTKASNHVSKKTVQETKDRWKRHDSHTGQFLDKKEDSNYQPNRKSPRGKRRSKD